MEKPIETPVEKPGRRRLLAILSVSIGLTIALAAAEVILSYQRVSIQHSDSLDEGLITYDDRLGWKLRPNWKGRHRHHDFDVQYSTNRYGFRGEFCDKGERERIAVVGDSFTFGMGVDDDQTFVHLLDVRSQDQAYLNFGVIGYSTDQQHLLIVEQLLRFNSDHVLLVVYLPNDLIDNERPFPLQAANPKPYFELSETGALTIRNVPVPLERQPPRPHALSRALFLNEEDLRRYALPRLGRSEILRRLGLFQKANAPSESYYQERFRHTLDLFAAHIEAIRGFLQRNGISITLALLPGQSYITAPASISAGFQDHLRRNIVSQGKIHDWSIIDLATAFRMDSERRRRDLYYPFEGHLTPYGNEVVASLLSRDASQSR